MIQKSKKTKPPQWKNHQAVIAPKGARIKFFSGSMLDKDCIKSATMEYDCIAMITNGGQEPNGEYVPITPWSGMGRGIINVHRDDLRETDAILTFNDRARRHGCKVTFPAL